MTADSAKVVGALRAEIAKLQAELSAARVREAEAQDRQTASSEVLRVIASSPTNLQAALDSIAERAARLFNAYDVVIRRADGDVMRLIALYGRANHEDVELAVPIVVGSTVGALAYLENRSIPIEDLSQRLGEFPRTRAVVERLGIGSMLVSPLRAGRPGDRNHRPSAH